MQATQRAGFRILWLIAGFTVWAAAFVTLYSMLSIGCRFGWDGIALPGGLSLQRAVLIALFLLGLAANALVLRLALSGRRKLEPDGPAPQTFLLRGGELAALAALAATAISLGPVFFLSPCL